MSKYTVSEVDISNGVPDYVESVFHEIFPEEGNYSLEYARGLTPAGCMKVFTLDSDGGIAGFSTLMYCGNTVYILFLGIREAYRGRGIASDYLTSITCNPDCTYLIDCHAELIPFYERFGFTTTGYRLEYEGEWFEIITRGTMSICETAECMRWIGTTEHPDSGLFDPAGACII